MATVTKATRRRRRRPAARARVVLDRRQPFDLDGLALAWQRALDAAERAATAATRAPHPPADRHLAVSIERREVGLMLASVARLSGIRPGPWLPGVAVTRKMLGLPASVELCVFDLEGVLTDSGLLHAAAWAETFDRFLLELSESTGWQFVPFDPVEDYRAYVDGRQRLEGVHTFLASRGIHLTEGLPGDPPSAETAYGLAARKRDALNRRLHDRGVAALPGVRRYLQALGYAGVGRSVVSASARALPTLELAGLARLVDKRVDADVMREDRLRPRPAPDLLVAACRRAGVKPERAVTFAHTPAGVAAGRAAGVAVIGVADGDGAELLHGLGTDLVVPSLTAMLDGPLRIAA